MAFGSVGVGMDLGSQSIKVAELRVSERGAVIRRALYFHRKNLIQRGIDPDDRAGLAAFLRQEMSAQGIPTKDVALGISGKDSIIRYTHVPPVPGWRLKIIMDYEVGEVSEKMGEKLTSDYKILPVTRVADDDQSVIIGLAKESALEELLRDLGAAGISVAKAVPAPLALYSAFSSFGKKPDLENPEDELVVVIDIGHENLNVLFLLNGNLSFARSAIFGGKNFTEALGRDLGMDMERAEALKLKGGTVEPGGAGRKEETVNPLRGTAAQILSMIQASLRFSKAQIGVRFPEPTQYFLAGGAVRLPGLVTYLQQGLQKPVEIFHPAASPSGEIGGDAARVLNAAPGDFAVALGLAAAKVRREGLELSLIPSKYQERRKFRERTIFLYVAAALLVIFLIVRLVQGFHENSSAREWQDELKNALGFFNREKTTMEENQALNLKSKARVNRILQEAELTAFQAFALDFLAANAGPELKIQAIKLVLDFTAEGYPIYQLQIDGLADNATQKALQSIKELRAAYDRESRVESAEVLSTTPVSSWYRFQMLLTPTYPAYR